MSSRSSTARQVLARTALALLATLTLLVAYGALVEPRFLLDEERYTVPVPGLADGASPTVALFSDLQVGMWFSNDGMIREIVEEVVDERPDAALLAGDFVLGRDPLPTEQIDHVVTLLAPLTAAGIPTYAVLGNHDHHADAADQVATALEGIGITVLRNASATVPDTAGLRIVGIGAARPDRADVDAALRGVPAAVPRVVMMHNPVTFPRLPPGSAPLAVAGHTHCGQIAVPGLDAWSWYQLARDERVVVDGWGPESHGAPGNRLFVTCGVGFSVVPVRIAAAPQVVFFDLRPTE
jgi:uncharacterized protein